MYIPVAVPSFIKDADQGPFRFPRGAADLAPRSAEEPGHGAQSSKFAKKPPENEKTHPAEPGEIVTFRLPSENPKPTNTNRGFGALKKFQRNWSPTTSARQPLPAQEPSERKQWQPRPAQAAKPAETNRETIIRENTRAAQLSAGDARVIFATRVQQSLEGGKAAILRPDRRRALMTLSSELRLRAFDANLIIALVQDAARRGEVVASVSSTQPPTHVKQLIEADEAKEILAMMAPAQKDTTTRDRIILAVVLALAILVGLVALVGP